MDDSIIRIKWARLNATRPRSNGSNARLGVHGRDTSPPIARIHLSDGSSGFGWSRINEAEARALIGRRFSDLFDAHTGAAREARAIDFPLWDLAGVRAGRPVYNLIEPELPSLSARCYDTSLYMNDLDLDDSEAVELLLSHTMYGIEQGHNAFKIKVGRGAMHMDLEAGTRRDIAIINAVKKVPAVELVMIDANDGYNLNITKRVLAETADAGVYWVEEAFHEDPVLYRNLKDWLAEKRISCKIADGEGDASSRIQEWARDGVIDIIQYDLRQYGFSKWLSLGRKFDGWGVGSAPHNYGDATANYYACHLAGAIRKFEYVEWDDADIEGISCEGYRLLGGVMTVPDSPGFGLELDDESFERRVKEDGFVVHGG